MALGSAMSTRMLSERPDIDLDFRPKSCFWPLGLETYLLARIKGAERKAALKRPIDAGQLDEIPDLFARSALSETDRRALGRVLRCGRDSDARDHHFVVLQICEVLATHEAGWKRDVCVRPPRQEPHPLPGGRRVDGQTLHNHHALAPGAWSTG
jgi:hypothetical protein